MRLSESGRRSALWLLGACGLAALVLYSLGSGSERRIQARIEVLALALESGGAEARGEREARIERAIGEAVSPDVIVKIPDHPELGRGRAGLVELAVRAGDDPRGYQVTPRNLEISLEPGEVAASAKLDAELSRPGDELHKDVRAVTLRLAPAGGAWIIESIEVGARTNAEPEARP
jgi:hypothetical protein